MHIFPLVTSFQAVLLIVDGASFRAGKTRLLEAREGETRLLEAREGVQRDTKSLAANWNSFHVSAEDAFSVEGAMVQSSFWHVVLRSFVVVSTAMIFDKTWFVALFFAARYSEQLSFWASYSALSLHVFLAAALSVVISKLFSLSTLCFTSAVVFSVLALLYLYDFYNASPEDSIAERLHEAKENIEEQEDTTRTFSIGDIACRCFSAVLIAEFGDRTQIAMISLHSSLPWVPVFLGSLLAFLLLTLSAVGMASV